MEKKIRIVVTTAKGTMYEGIFLIPPMRNRLSDVLNDDTKNFINLTDVTINDTSNVSFVSLNKNFIEAVSEAVSEAVIDNP